MRRTPSSHERAINSSPPGQNTHFYRCVFTPFTPTHRCILGSIKSFINSHLRQGENLIYILTDVVNSYEQLDKYINHVEEIHDRKDPEDRELDTFNTESIKTNPTKPRDKDINTDIDGTILTSHITNTLYMNCTKSQCQCSIIRVTACTVIQHTRYAERPSNQLQQCRHT